MRVRLVAESSGFGYNGRIADWIVSSEENIHTMEKIQSGLTVEIPDKIAMGIYNLVNVETGKVISLHSSINISVEDVAKKYMDVKRTEQAQIRDTVKTVLTPNLSKKVNPQIIKPNIEEENE